MQSKLAAAIVFLAGANLFAQSNQGTLPDPFPTRRAPWLRPLQSKSGTSRPESSFALAHPRRDPSTRGNI